jgi:hypothetical protein
MILGINRKTLLWFIRGLRGLSWEGFAVAELPFFEEPFVRDGELGICETTVGTTRRRWTEGRGGDGSRVSSQSLLLTSIKFVSRNRWSRSELDLISPRIPRQGRFSAGTQLVPESLTEASIYNAGGEEGRGGGPLADGVGVWGRLMEIIATCCIKIVQNIDPSRPTWALDFGTYQLYRELTVDPVAALSECIIRLAPSTRSAIMIG